MYIKINNHNYPCGGYVHGGDEVRYSLTGDNLPETLGETVELFQDNDFLMATVTVADFARWAVEGNTLVLTDRPVPEPVPEPEPEPPTPTVQEAMLDMLADLDYRVSQQELAAMAAENSKEG